MGEDGDATDRGGTGGGSGIGSGVDAGDTLVCATFSPSGGNSVQGEDVSSGGGCDATGEPSASDIRKEEPQPLQNEFAASFDSPHLGQGMEV